MLPIIATLVMGSVSKQAGAQKLPGEGRMAGGAGTGLLTQFLDADKDGSVVDDLMGMASHGWEIKMAELENFYEEIIKGVGEDPGREGLLKTPERAARAMEYITRGYGQSLDQVVNNAIFESDNDQMILVKDIELYSLCEHHLLPFIGKCHVAYIPTGKVIGLSKIARIVDMYARRLQIQENLTKQIADSLMQTIQPSGVGVIIEAQHLCMMMRGVEKQNSKMTTSMMLGSFRHHDRTRSEFLRLVMG